jgi:hydroxymethylglutaryl-CoA lyase
MRIVEVGPRDGLQNELNSVPTEAKLRFIQNLRASGLKEIEATSFVSPKWVPQLADSADLWSLLPPGPKYSALVPNRRGFERALALGVNRMALFTAVSNDFTRKNINMTVEDSLSEFTDLVDRAPDSVWFRAYVSTSFECPYAGRIRPEDTAALAHRLFEIGVNEVCFGDTIGVAVPFEVRALISEIQGLPLDKVAWHFHDTRGTAIANVQTALDAGYEIFDSSAAGLGGCPYAPGASGNLATEDLVYLLERSGITTGVSISALAQASLEILSILGRPATAKSQLAAAAAVEQSAN